MAGVVNSANIKFYKGSTAVSKLTGVSLSINREFRDTTTKDSGKWREGCGGLLSASGSFDSLYDLSATLGFSTLLSDMINDTPVAAVIGGEATGDITYSGNVIFTNLEQNAPGTEENVTYSGSFEFTGAITEATVA